MRRKIPMLLIAVLVAVSCWARHGGSSKAAGKIPAYDKAEQAARNAEVGLWSDDSQSPREPGT